MGGQAQYRVPKVTDPIEPALTAEEWAKGTPGVYGWDDGGVFIDWRTYSREIDRPSVERPHAIIAALNAALPDSDPRKITQEKVARLRAAEVHAAGCAVLVEHSDYNPSCDCQEGAFAASFADALESYLPPTEGT